MDYFGKKKTACKCCNGTGIQMNKLTGLTQHCPCCNGTGKEKEKSKPIIYTTRNT